MIGCARRFSLVFLCSLFFAQGSLASEQEVSGAGNLTQPPDRSNEVKSRILERIKPNKYRLDEGERISALRMKGDNLGKIHVPQNDKVRQKDVKNLLVALSPLTRADESISIVVEKQKKNKRNNTTDIWFHQVIDGIRVEGKSRLTFDPNGKVTRINSVIVDSKNLPDVTISKGEAFSRALSAIRGKTGVSELNLAGTGDIPPEGKIVGTYRILSADTVAMVWRVEVFVNNTDAGFGVYVADIDGTSGETKFPQMYQQFKADVCEQESASLPVAKCEDQEDRKF